MPKIKFKAMQEKSIENQQPKYVKEEGENTEKCNSSEKNYINKELKECRACVDTFALKIENDNLIDTRVLKEEEKWQLGDWSKAINYRRSCQKSQEVYLVCKLHSLYKEENGIEHYVKSFNSHAQLYKCLMNEIGVKDQSKIDICRRDICIDFGFKFSKKANFKKSLFFFCLLTVGSEVGKKWICTSLENLDYNAIALKTSKFQISFYDKELESQGKSKYKTRYEFRYLARRGNDWNKTFKDLIKKFEELPDKVDDVNKNMIEMLIKHYDKKKAINYIDDFTDFIKQYEPFIFNREILFALYNHAGLKGSFNNWLMNFRKRRELILYSNREMVSRFGIAEDCKRAIKEYIRA